MLPERIAVISDVHGNVWALKAVLSDIAARGITRIVNLGDCVYGPLRPGETASILEGPEIITVRGNEDRLVTESEDESVADPTAGFTRSELSDEQLLWLGALSEARTIGADICMFHGTPEDDTSYLLREVGPRGVSPRSVDKLDNMLKGLEAAVVLCGHDHLQAEARLPSGKLVMNPGSVGLPAYSDNSPFPHAMAAGTPHARYSVLTKTGSGWSSERVSLEYDWDRAAEVAASRGRADWARWLRSGQA